MECFDVVEHRARRRDLRMIGPGRVEALVGHAVVEEVALVRQLCHQPGAHDHQALMHRVGLVEAEQVDIGADRSDVGDRVRGERHPVDDHPCTDAVRQLRDARDVVLGSDDVRGVRHGDEPGSFAEHRLEVSDVEQPGVGIDPPLPDRAADAFGRASDRAGVGLVVLVGDDDLVATFEHVGKGVGEHVGVRRRRGAEHHLASFDAERIGPPLT